jgi:uncharacterized protein YbaP (TraB family)
MREHNSTNFRRILSRGRQGIIFSLFYGCATLLFFLASPQLLSAQEKSLLWRIRSGPNAVYVLGSIHFLKKENYPLKKDIEEAFEDSKKLVLEIDLQTTDRQKTEQVTMQKAINRDGTTLQQNVSAETYSLAEKKARELGIDLRPLNPLKTWFVALTLSAVKLQKLGFDPTYGVDRYLAERARSSAKPMAGLETLEYQLGIFDQLSPRDQELMLRETLEEMDLLEKSADRVVQAWFKGDASLLEESLLAGMRQYPELYRKLIVERNRRWLPQIEQMIKEGGNTLVVVGAAHLVGKDGVIELLKQRGYTVEQL